MSKYQKRLDEQDPGERDNRRSFDYNKPTLEKFADKFYLIATDVFDLTDCTKLTDEDLRLLPIKINYTGLEIEYKTDTKEAYKLLLNIIGNFNKMQDPEFYSFPLGEFNFFHFVFYLYIVVALHLPIQQRQLSPLFFSYSFFFPFLVFILVII